uniref:Xenopsin n=1 Tax=Ambigolimax valentianus TaxID=1338344 RepID=A0A455SJK2_9EUPU|nr:Xenopsin [Ambigolimax valentianus]
MDLTVAHISGGNELLYNDWRSGNESERVTNEHERLPGNVTSELKFRTLSGTGFIFIGCMLSVTWSFGTFFNGLCLYIFATTAGLRSPTNIFIIALNLCDFLMCFVGTPAALTSAWARRWLWGRAGCKIEGFLVYFLGMTSMYLLTAIAVIRYIAISKPLLVRRISTAVAVVSCVCCSLLGFLWAVLPAFGWNEFGLEGAGISCSVIWHSTDPSCMSYIWTVFFTCLVIPVGVMLFSYGGVLVTLRNLNRNSVWDLNSRVAKKNLAIEKKMLRTSVLIVLSFICFWTPYAAVSFITAFFGAEHISAIFASIPPVVAKCQGLMDPVIYVASNKQVRTEVLKMLPCRVLQEQLLKRISRSTKELESVEFHLGDETAFKRRSTQTKNEMEEVSGQQTRQWGKQNQVQPLNNRLKEDEERHKDTVL